MNIFEMLSFDFQEFVTSPAGIFIIAGIICLLIGIVFFLKDSKKNAKPVEKVNEEVKPVEEKPTVEEVKAPEVAPVVESLQEEKPVVVKATEDGVNEVPVPTVTDTLNIVEEKPVVAPVEEPKVESLESPAVLNPTVKTPVETLETTQTTAYGGANPEVGNVSFEEKPREIYGGANPLENTAPIPTVNNAVPTPVVEAPTVIEAPVAPVVENIAQAAPVIETIAPVVENIASVAPVTETVVPVAPEVAPTVAPVAPVIEPPKEEIEKLEF